MFFLYPIHPQAKQKRYTGQNRSQPTDSKGNLIVIPLIHRHPLPTTYIDLINNRIKVKNLYFVTMHRNHSVCG